jgi:arylsulfatase A-like enzyme
MNIVFIVIDTLRYDAIRAHGEQDWIETPNMDRLAARSIIFDRAYAASYPTIPHRTDLMTGEYAWPYQGPFHPWMPLRFDIPALPRLLAQAGYATQLIHDTPHMVNGGHAFDWPFAGWTFIRGAEVDRPWVDDKGLAPLPNWGRDPIFDYIDEDEAMQGGIRRLLTTYSRAHRDRTKPEDWSVARLFLKGAQFLRDNASRGKTREGSFFLWLDCFDPHEPWDSPPEFVKRYVDDPNHDGRIDPRAFTGPARSAGTSPEDFPPGVFERQNALYAAKVTLVDRWLGEVLDALEETALDERTAVVLTADHGTNLGERGGFGKTWTVNEQEARVPLLIHWPGGPRNRVDAMVQPQDIAATLLHMAGVTPPSSWVGHDLRPIADGSRLAPRAVTLAGQSVNEWEDDPTAVLFTVFTKDWSMNVTADPEACRLYADGSVEDVASDHPEVVAELRELAFGELAQRGTDPKLVGWVRSEGEGRFPEECCTWPGAQKWITYWQRVHEDL